MPTRIKFPVGTRVVAQRIIHSPCRCRVIAVNGDSRTLREIWNKNTVKGGAARAKYRADKAAFILPLAQIALEGPPDLDGPAYTEMPPYVTAGDA